jgi:hypothetical protein
MPKTFVNTLAITRIRCTVSRNTLFVTISELKQLPFAHDMLAKTFETVFKLGSLYNGIYWT